MLVANLRERQEHVNSWDFIENSHGQTKMQQKEKKMLLCEHSVVAVYSLWWEYCWITLAVELLGVVVRLCVLSPVAPVRTFNFHWLGREVGVWKDVSENENDWCGSGRQFVFNFLVIWTGQWQSVASLMDVFLAIYGQTVCSMNVMAAGLVSAIFAQGQ